MKNFKKILIGIFCVVAIATYLNIGWGLGTFFHNDVKYVEPSKMSTSAMILSGGWSFLNCNLVPMEERYSLRFDQVFTSITWPVILVFVAVSWAAYALVWLAVLLWHVLIFLVKLIFLGGLAGLVGIYGMITITWIAAGVFTVYMMNEADKIRDPSENKWINDIDRGSNYSLIVVIAPISIFFGLAAFYEFLTLRKKRRNQAPASLPSPHIIGDQEK